MSIFRDSSAPFAVALVASVLGWLFDSAIRRAENLRFVEFEMQFERQDDVTVLELVFHNRSLAGAVTKGDLLVSCLDGKTGVELDSCFVELPRYGIIARYIRSADTVLSVPAGMMEVDAISFPAVIPARGTAMYHLGVVSENIDIRVQYDLKTVYNDNPDIIGEIPQVILNRGWTAEGLFMANYFYFLVAFSVTFMVLLISFVIYSIYKILPRQRQAIETPTFHEVVLRSFQGHDEGNP